MFVAIVVILLFSWFLCKCILDIYLPVLTTLDMLLVNQKQAFCTAMPTCDISFTPDDIFLIDNLISEKHPSLP